MATRDKNGRFVKGHPGNKNGGRIALPEFIKAITRQTKPAIIKAYWNIANLKPKEFESYQPKTVLEEGIKACIGDFRRTGRLNEIKHLWDQCHGKPVESYDINTGDAQVTLVISSQFVPRDDK